MATAEPATAEGTPRIGHQRARRRWRRPRPRWLPTPWLVVLVGIAYAGLGLLAARTDLSRSAEWPHTDAVVARTFENRRTFNRGPRHSYALHFERTDGVVESVIESGRAKVGDVLHVRYNPRRPTELVIPARIEKTRTDILRIAAVVTGVGLVLVAFIGPPPRRRYSGFGRAASRGVPAPGG